MKLHKSVQEFSSNKPTVVTTGTFDGVHIGHRRILERLKEVAGEINGESVLLTFFPHPRMVLYPDDHGLELLTTQEEKIRLLEEVGIDHLIIHPFTMEFSRTTSIDFVKGILTEELNTKKLVIGYDHHFGRNREGSFEHLVESGPLYGFDVEEIPAQDVDDISVSSTKIRKAVLGGDLETANRFLGHRYQLSGMVMEGDKIGRTIGFPTANIQVEEDYKLIPKEGAYACIAHIGDAQHRAMVNIGNRPTVDGKQLRIEAFLLDFDQNIYGEKLRIEFVSWLRDEVKFEGLEQLKSQLDKDRLRTIERLDQEELLK